MSVKFQDYYETLGVKRDASADEIKRAYRKLARENHPDVNKGDAAAEARFKQVAEAYEVLGDAENRQKYDTLGANWKAGQEFTPPNGFGGFDFNFGGQGFNARSGGGDFSDFFEQIFRNFGGAPGSGAAGGGFGGGPGFAPGGGAPGGAHAHGGGCGGSCGGGCGGGGSQEVDFGISLHEAFHGGTRQVQLRGGAGGTKKLDVRIPPGTTQGSKIRLKGQSASGGDLMLKVNIAAHPKFSLNKHDLTTTVAVSPWEAALGAKVAVQTMEGEVTVNIPAGTGSGSKLRLKGKGLPKRGGERGDLFVQVKMVVPKELSEREKELFESLARESEFDPRGE